MGNPKRRNVSQRSEMIYDLQEFGLILDTRELYLCSDQRYDYEYAMLDHRAANQFIRNLNLLNTLSSEQILIHMITNGGEWSYGMAIYDAIKTSRSETILLAYGNARSMSSIIPQAATYRVIMPNCMFMIHWGSIGIEGSTSSLISLAEEEKRSCQTMLNIYVKTCAAGEYWIKRNMCDADIREFLTNKMDRHQEWYLSAREAVQYGFFDAVLGDPEFETIEALKE